MNKLELGRKGELTEFINDTNCLDNELIIRFKGVNGVREITDNKGMFDSLGVSNFSELLNLSIINIFTFGFANIKGKKIYVTLMTGDEVKRRKEAYEHRYDKKASNLTILNKEAKKAIKAFTIELERYIGSKIETQSGFVKSFNKKIYKSKCTDFRYNLDSGNSHIYLNVFVNDEKKVINIADVDRCILKRIELYDNMVSFNSLDVKYTGKGIIKQINQFNAAKEKAKKLYYAMDAELMDLVTKF